MSVTITPGFTEFTRIPLDATWWQSWSGHGHGHGHGQGHGQGHGHGRPPDPFSTSPLCLISHPSAQKKYLESRAARELVHGRLGQLVGKGARVGSSI